jgi:hypothetical protein
MLKLKFLLKSWFSTVLGSLLIIASISIVGVISFSIEQKLLTTQNKLEDLKANEQEANYFFESANIQMRLTVLQNSILKSDFAGNKEYQEKIRNVYVESIFAVIARLYKASGQSLFSHDDIQNLKALKNRAIEGDESALNEIRDQLVGQVQASKMYNEEIEIKKTDLKKEERELKGSIVNWRISALILQIVGLLFLLVKEFPLINWKSDKTLNTDFHGPFNRLN